MFFLNWMNKLNLKVEFDSGKCFIKDKLETYEIIVRGYDEDGMFRLDVKIKGECTMETSINENGVCTYRYGTLSFESLYFLHKLKIVHRLPQTNNPSNLYDICILGK
jgi:hypothetical protein